MITWPSVDVTLGISIKQLFFVVVVVLLMVFHLITFYCLIIVIPISPGRGELVEIMLRLPDVDKMIF